MSRQRKFRASLSMLLTVVLISLYTAAEKPDLLAADSDVSNPVHDHSVCPLSTKEMLREKTYGGPGDDRAFCMIPTDNHGFLVVGSSRSFNGNDTAAWVVWVDSNGNMIWNKTYIENEGSEFRNALEVTDGFLLVGNTFFSSGDASAWIVKIDRQGKILWNKTFRSEGLNKACSAAKTPDGFVIVGFSNSLKNDGSYAWMLKIDMEGNSIWNKTYSDLGNSAFRAILVTPRGDFVVAGYCDSFNSGNYDFWLIKTDPNGTGVWSKTFGGSESDKAYAIAGSTDGYVIAGETHSSQQADAFVVKTDFDGRLVWNNTYGGADFDVANAIVSTMSGGYMIVGFTFSYGEGQRDFWFFEINDLGDLAWSRTYGREGFEEAYAAVEVGEHDFALGGWTNSIGEGSYDFYIVETDIVGSSDKFDLGTTRLLSLFLFGTSAILLLFFWFQQRGIEPVSETDETDPEIANVMDVCRFLERSSQFRLVWRTT